MTPTRNRPGDSDEPATAGNPEPGLIPVTPSADPQQPLFVLPDESSRAPWASPALRGDEAPLGSPPTILHVLCALTGCAIDLALNRLVFGQSELSFVWAPYVGLRIAFGGLHWTGTLLILLRYSGFLRGSIRDGAWVHLVLSLVDLATAMTSLLPDRSIVSAAQVAYASRWLAWCAPLLSRRLSGAGRVLCVGMIGIEIFFWVITFWVLSRIHAVTAASSAMLFFLKWPCVVLLLMVYWVARRSDDERRARVWFSEGWLHYAGLALLLLPTPLSWMLERMLEWAVVISAE